MPGWACPIFVWGPFWVPFGDPFFVWGPFLVPFGDPFALRPIGGPWDQVGGSVRPLEAEGRLFGGPGAEPPGISHMLPYFGIFCLNLLTLDMVPEAQHVQVSWMPVSYTHLTLPTTPYV